MATVIHTGEDWKNRFRSWVSHIDRGLFLQGLPASATPSVTDYPKTPAGQQLIEAIARAHGNHRQTIVFNGDVHALQASVDTVITAAILNSYPEAHIQHCHIDTHNVADAVSTIAAWSAFRNSPSPETQDELREQLHHLLEHSPDLTRDVIWTEDRIIEAVGILGTYNAPIPDLPTIVSAGGLQTIVEHRLHDGLATAGVQDPFLSTVGLTPETIEPALDVARGAAESLVLVERPFTLIDPDITTDLFEQNTGHAADSAVRATVDPDLAEAANTFVRTVALRPHVFEVADVVSHTEYEINNPEVSR